MKKSVSIIILTIILTVVFIGCGNKPQVNTTANTAPEPKQAESGTAPAAGDDSIKVSLGQTGNSMALPDSFPKSVVPLLDDANIVNVNDNKDAKALGITYMTGKKLEEAHEFYVNALKGADGFEETKVDSGYMIYGNKGKYHITAIIITYQGDNVSVGLEIGMQDIK